MESLTITKRAPGQGNRKDVVFGPDEVSGVAFSSDGNTIASGNADGTITLWDATTGREARTIGSHRAAVFGIAFSPDGHQLATGSLNEVKLWDAVNFGRRKCQQGASLLDSP